MVDKSPTLVYCDGLGNADGVSEVPWARAIQISGSHGFWKSEYNGDDNLKCLIDGILAVNVSGWSRRSSSLLTTGSRAWDSWLDQPQTLFCRTIHSCQVEMPGKRPRYQTSVYVAYTRPWCSFLGRYLAPDCTTTLDKTQSWTIILKDAPWPRGTIVVLQGFTGTPRLTSYERSSSLLQSDNLKLWPTWERADNTNSMSLNFLPYRRNLQLFPVVPPSYGVSPDDILKQSQWPRSILYVP